MTPLFLADPKEGKDIPVGIGDLKSPESIIDEWQLLYERGNPLWNSL
jgi:hypothetical protein